MKVLEIREGIEIRPGNALQQLAGWEHSPPAIHAFAQPVLQRLELATRELLLEITELGFSAPVIKSTSVGRCAATSSSIDG